MPWEIGFGEKKDIALLSRCRQAVFVFNTARQCRDPKQIANLSEGQMELVKRMRQLIRNQNKRAPRARSRRVLRQRRGLNA